MQEINILIIINTFFTGIVFSSAILFLLFGFKTISTRFHALFWLYNTLFLIGLIIDEINILPIFHSTKFLHLYIPFFYLLALLTEKYSNFKITYLSIFIIPTIFIALTKIDIVPLVYHLILWSLLIFYTIFQIKGDTKNKNLENDKSKLYFIVPLIICVAVFPFIIINIILLRKNINIHLYNILPPSLATAALLELYFSYHKNLLILNHSHYINLDFIKKSSAIEKQNIIEKIAASIIHEIKNPISAIQSLNEQLLLRHQKMSDEKIEEYLTIIKEELFKLKEFSESSLKIWKKTESEKKIISVKQEFDSILKLIRYDIKKRDVILIIDLTKDYQIAFTPYQFQQIILNLIFNAIEANAKKIAIDLTTNRSDIIITITNDGEPIPDEIKSKMFLPFFTTKLNGTGMGLAICKEILHHNIGKIELIKSIKNETVFQITLNQE